MLGAEQRHKLDAVDLVQEIDRCGTISRETGVVRQQTNPLAAQRYETGGAECVDAYRHRPWHRRNLAPRRAELMARHTSRPASVRWQIDK